MNVVQTENINRLIAHYKKANSVRGWGFGECVGGIAKKLGMVHSMGNELELAQALGIHDHEAYDIIAGPRLIYWNTGTPAGRCDMVIAMLEGILKGGDVHWAVPKN